MGAQSLNEFRRFDTFGRKNLSLAQTANFNEDDSMFYSWECISIYRANRTTLDLVIKDPHEIMYLIHVLYHSTSKFIEPLQVAAGGLDAHIGCLRSAKLLKR